MRGVGSGDGESPFILRIPSYWLAPSLNSFSSSVANGEEVSLNGDRKQSSHLPQAQHGHKEAGKGSTQKVPLAVAPFPSGFESGPVEGRRDMLPSGQAGAKC